jgi:hypothetical protein
MDSINFVKNSIVQFEYYKKIGEKAMAQVDDEMLNHTLSDESNSISMIVNHLHGNMLSRWTDFLTTDGEKPNRNRDEEFEFRSMTRKEMLLKWREGWNVLLNTLKSLSDEDLLKIIYIRNEGHTVTEAITRQLCHYSYHIGQIVFLSKILAMHPWQSLSIPRGNSDAFNLEKFSKVKTRKHFTKE